MILTQTDSEIKATLDQYESESKQIKHSLLKICWYMRGGVSYSEAHWLSATEREIINDIIKDNLETTKETKLPFF